MALRMGHSRLFYQTLTNISDFSELANKQINELRIKKIYTHIAEMNIFIDNGF
jgi:hypothetical protein